MITLRHEEPSDYENIARANDLAFKRKAESKLIQKLRKEKHFIPELSIVAEYNGTLIGHLLFFPVVIQDGTTRHQTLALAPMSVLPEFQKKSIGKLMLIYGLQEAEELGHRSVFVLGHPSYYPRFGFRKASQWSITSPFPAPEEAFMALELKAGSLTNISGKVIFPAAFNEV